MSARDLKTRYSDATLTPRATHFYLLLNKIRAASCWWRSRFYLFFGFSLRSSRQEKQLCRSSTDGTPCVFKPLKYTLEGNTRGQSECATGCWKRSLMFRLKPPADYINKHFARDHTAPTLLLRAACVCGRNIAKHMIQNSNNTLRSSASLPPSSRSIIYKKNVENVTCPIISQSNDVHAHDAAASMWKRAIS